jgi:hypothetical protein
VHLTYGIWSQWSDNPHEDLQHASDHAHTASALHDSNSNVLALLSNLDWIQRRYDQAAADAQRAATRICHAGRSEQCERSPSISDSRRAIEAS